MALEPTITDDRPPPFEEVRQRVSEVTTHMDAVSVLAMSGRFPSLGDIRESPRRSQFEEAAQSCLAQSRAVDSQLNCEKRAAPRGGTPIAMG
jgi:hypothetical protein